MDAKVFNQPHYLGGRALRLEQSRVKTSDLFTNPISVTTAAATSGSAADLTRSVAGYPTYWQQSAMLMPVVIPPTALSHRIKFQYEGMPPPVGFALLVEGISPVEANRRALFQLFKPFGYIMGIDLTFGPDFAASAIIYFSAPEAVHKAIFSFPTGANVGDAVV